MKKHLFFLLILLAATAATTATTSHAQDSAARVTAPKLPMGPAQLTTDQWKAVEGTFQSNQNKEMKVQFSRAEGGVLLAKLLWNANEVHLVPQSPLAFTSKEMDHDEPIRLLFHKDDAGAINQVDVEKNGVWMRTADYKPEASKVVMTHTPDQLKPFEGIYQFRQDPYRLIQLSVRDNSLILRQGWDNNEILFAPENPLSFFAPAIPRFTLDFTKDSDGSITQMTAFKKDVWLKMKKPASIADQLRSISGKYRSKDDPDNELRFSARDNHLVVTQLWDKKEIVLDALADGYYYSPTAKYSVQLMTKEKDPGQVIVLGTLVFIKEK